MLYPPQAKVSVSAMNRLEDVVKRTELKMTQEEKEANEKQVRSGSSAYFLRPIGPSWEYAHASCV